MKNSLVFFFFSRKAPLTTLDRAADQPLGIMRWAGGLSDSGSDLNSPVKQMSDLEAQLSAEGGSSPRVVLRVSWIHLGGRPHGATRDRMPAVPLLPRAGLSPGRSLCVETSGQGHTTGVSEPSGELHAPWVTS